jgi:hypothetical protein
MYFNIHDGNAQVTKLGNSFEVPNLFLANFLWTLQVTLRFWLNDVPQE